MHNSICILFIGVWLEEQPHTSYYIGVPLAFIAIIACVALAVLAWKHRRLSSSFARFANPRYDNRSGTATLGNNSDTMGKYFHIRVNLYDFNLF